MSNNNWKRVIMDRKSFGLDFIRVISALLVFIPHLIINFSSKIDIINFCYAFSAIGVELFFCLSGYLICRQSFNIVNSKTFITKILWSLLKEEYIEHGQHIFSHFYLIFFFINTLKKKLSTISYFYKISTIQCYQTLFLQYRGLFVWRNYFI